MSFSIAVEDDAWDGFPGLDALCGAVTAAALRAEGIDPDAVEIDLLFTGDEEIAGINAEWRGEDKPTNVLSFPAPEGLPVPPGELRPLGDIVLASGVIAREARDQGKTLHDHVAHLIVHGILHLIGHDHEEDGEAEAMERLEIDILKGLGIPNPYERQ